MIYKIHERIVGRNMRDERTIKLLCEILNKFRGKFMNEEVQRRAVLKDGEELRGKGSKSKGSLAETDIYSYEIVDANGNVVGTAEYTHHTAIKGFGVTQTFRQKDVGGNTVVDERW